MPQYASTIHVTGCQHMNNVPTKVLVSIDGVESVYTYCDNTLRDALLKQLRILLGAANSSGDLYVHDLYSYSLLTNQAKAPTNTTKNLVSACQIRLRMLAFKGFNWRVSLGDAAYKHSFVDRCHRTIYESPNISKF